MPRKLVISAPPAAGRDRAAGRSKALAELRADYGPRSPVPSGPDDCEFYDRVRSDPGARRFLGLDA